jgi:hypothetical protein
VKNILLALPKTASTSLMRAVEELTGVRSLQQFEFIDTPVHERGTRWQRAKQRLRRRLGEALIPERRFERKLRRLFPAPGWEALAAMHSDICDFTVDSAAHLRAMADSEFIYKQHFPPTTANLALLADWKKIVLVRDTADVVEAYGRALGDNASLIALYGSQAYREQLRQELDRWRQGWEAQPDVLVLSYRELISGDIDVLRRTLDCFGYATPIPPGYCLPKERYTR